MDYLVCGLVLIMGYFIGNIETAVLVSRMAYGDDIRKHGSGNAGTTNMLRVFGMKPGMLTFIGDFLKGILSVIIGRLICGWLCGDSIILGADMATMGGYLCGLGTVLGHDFPIFFGFKGGKGAASTLGIAWMVAPWVALGITGFSFIAIYATQMVSVGSLLGMTLFTAITIVLNTSNIPLIILCSALWLLLIIRHGDNIRRIFNGTESRLFKRPGRGHENGKDV